MGGITDLRLLYCQADRCWRSNNFKSCLQKCNELTKALNKTVALHGDIDPELIQLKNLVWFLKIKCLSEDYYINESFLLNETDMVSDDQVHTFAAHPVTSTKASFGEISRRKLTSGMRIESTTSTRGHQRTGVLTGRLPTRSSSRQSGGRATSSYRPLSTSLTATQTAFSRSTRPLLRYSINDFLNKPIYEYLYNAQKVTNKCPDYRQCLEYLNLVKNSQENHTKVEIAVSAAPLLLANDKCKKTTSAFWTLSKGICYFNLKMNKQAEECFKQALDNNLKYLDPYLWLTKVYLRLNQPMKVLKTCDDGLKHSRSEILYNWKARVQLLLNQTQGAHLSLQESLKYYPTNIEALANVGHYAFYGDKLELALKCYERINRISLNTSCLSDGISNNLLSNSNSSSASQLYNNLALINFYCGNYQKVMPFFQRAFLSSPNKEVTSDIWYNLSFVPLSFGSRQMALACLRLALKNNSQNESAINNLGVLKYDELINDPLHYCNRQEFWSQSSSVSTSSGCTPETELQNRNDQRHQQALFDDAETFFELHSQHKESANKDGANEKGDQVEEHFLNDIPPEMLFNMAVLKRRRGQFLASVRYCNMYSEHDPNNHSIRSILEEVRDIVMHDS